MRALIVEDTLINQEFLKMIVGQWADCVVVESGEEAIDAFENALGNTPFDIIFMDIMLPGIDGLQTLEHIRAMEERRGTPQDKMTKTIVTTALDDDGAASRAYIQGQALAYITKPIREEAIEVELRNFGLIN